MNQRNSPKIKFSNVRQTIALLLVAAFFWALTAAAATEGKPHQSFDRSLTKKEEEWVRRTLRSLSTEEKIGQMFLAYANLSFTNRESAEYKALEHQVRDNKVGGVLIFRSDVWSTAITANRWQQMARVPLLIASDLEMGMGMRFNDTPWWPPNMAVAATGDVELARLQGMATARQARAMGVNWLFAPAVDVNNNPDNPVINVRSFGENPQTVSAFGKAFIEGAQTEGAMACAKHFPGHGDTATDSHIGLPVVDVSKQRLEELELVPFRAAIAARVGGVMSAHIALPRIEPQAAASLRALDEKDAAAAEFLSTTEDSAARVTLPATLSPKILTGILREELKFNGLIVTDAMSMAGVAARYTPAEAAILAIKAGADVIEKSPDLDAAIAGVKEAIARGDIAVDRIDRSVQRILRAKAALGLNEKATVDLNEVDRVVNDPKLLEIADRIAEKSMTLVRDEKRLAPLRFEGSRGRLLHIAFTEEGEKDVLKPFVDEIRSRVAAIENASFDLHSRPEEIDRLLEKASTRNYDAILFSITVRARSGKGSVTLPKSAQEIAKKLAAAPTSLLVISFGNPYLLTAIPDVPSYLVAYCPYPVSQRAAVKALFGERPISGKLPVSLPGLYPIGSGLDQR
jgi:beta-N-acetylhexosaminidase